MESSIAIAKREFRTFFASPIAYIVLGAFIAGTGFFFFFVMLFGEGVASLRGFFAMAPFAFTLLVPAITMRAIAEEQKSGTLELLLTMPLEDWQVVMGKFLAALAMVGVGLAWTLPFPLTVASLVAPGAPFDWGTVLAGYLGLLLLGAAFIGLGMWGSALSKNQIVGFIVGLVLCLSFYMVDKLAFLAGDSPIAALLEFLSVDHHFDNIARGVIDTRDLAFYVSLTLLSLLLTTRTLAAARK